jgi:F-box domain
MEIASLYESEMREIFSSLSPKTRIIITRVSTGWRDIINSSWTMDRGFNVTSAYDEEAIVLSILPKMINLETLSWSSHRMPPARIPRYAELHTLEIFGLFQTIDHQFLEDVLTSPKLKNIVIHPKIRRIQPPAPDSASAGILLPRVMDILTCHPTLLGSIEPRSVDAPYDLQSITFLNHPPLDYSQLKKLCTLFSANLISLKMSCMFFIPNVHFNHLVELDLDGMQTNPASLDVIRSVIGKGLPKLLVLILRNFHTDWLSTLELPNTVASFESMVHRRRWDMPLARIPLEIAHIPRFSAPPVNIKFKFETFFYQKPNWISFMTPGAVKEIMDARPQYASWTILFHHLDAVVAIVKETNETWHGVNPSSAAPRVTIMTREIICPLSLGQIPTEWTLTNASAYWENALESRPYVNFWICRDSK